MLQHLQYVLHNMGSDISHLTSAAFLNGVGTKVGLEYHCQGMLMDAVHLYLADKAQI